MQRSKLKLLPRALSPVPVKAKAEAAEKLSEVRSSQAYFRRLR